MTETDCLYKVKWTGPAFSGKGPPMPDQPAPPGPPRWVKILATLTLTVLLLVLAVKLLSGGQHGPMRHFSPPATEDHP